MKWTLLLNLFLITLVAGDGAWKQDKVYQYKVLTKSLTSSPTVNNQWIGTVFRARLMITRQSENLLIGKIDDAEYAEIEVSGKWDDNFNDDELSYNKRQFKRPFKIHLGNGVIHSLSVDRTIAKDQKTQLKAIISQLQVDTNKANGDGNNAFYQTTEQTVTGTCETTYDISPLPDYLLQYDSDLTPLHLKEDEEFIKVDKTRDHNKCTERFGLTNERNEYRMDNNLVQSEVSRIVLSGSLKDYTIQSSVTTNKVSRHGPQTYHNIHYVNLKMEQTRSHLYRVLLQIHVDVESDNLIIEKLSDYKNYQKNDSNSNELIVTSSEQRVRSNEETFRSNEPRFRPNEPRFRPHEPRFKPNEQSIRSNEQTSGSDEQLIQDGGDWSGCYSWLVGYEEMCRQSFSAEYTSTKSQDCNYGSGHRSYCVKKFPGCESSVCWSATIQDTICTREFGDRLPVQKGGYNDCAAGFVRSRCCSK